MASQENGMYIMGMGVGRGRGGWEGSEDGETGKSRDQGGGGKSREGGVGKVGSGGLYMVLYCKLHHSSTISINLNCPLCEVGEVQCESSK